MYSKGGNQAKGKNLNKKELSFDNLQQTPHLKLLKGI